MLKRIVFGIMRMLRLISKGKYRALQNYLLIESSRFFDRDWYLRNNPDVAKARVDPVWHYLNRGWKERRNPGPEFDGGAYLERYRYVRKAGINPLLHYERSGRAKNRKVQASGLVRYPEHVSTNHAKKPGKKTPKTLYDAELAASSGYFDAKYYLRYNVDVASAKADPLAHFLKRGWREGRNPSARFDMQYYVELNRDVFASLPQPENPLLHFLKKGMREGRKAYATVFPREVAIDDVIQYSRTPAIGSYREDGGAMKGKVAVVVHLYYVEMLDEFVSYLKNIPMPFDLYLTTPTAETDAIREKIKSDLPNCKMCRVIKCENSGRDIGPFSVEVANFLVDYDYICKIHTKREVLGTGWRSLILRNLLGDKQLVKTVFAAFAADPHLGMIYPTPPLHVMRAIAFHGAWGNNQGIAKEFCASLGLDCSDVKDFDFPAGSMFWARTAALRPLLAHKYSYSEFDSVITRDGSLAHAIERLFGVVPKLLGYNIADIRIFPPSPVEPPKAYVPIPDSALLDRIQAYQRKKGRNNKIAVYTAVANGYDKITIPEEIDPDVDYYCFSDRKLIGPSPWRFLPLDYHNVDSTRITRFYKMHPFLYFSTYDYVIWIDANIQIRKNVLKKLIEVYKAGRNPVAFTTHPERNCTYAEADVCKRSARDEGTVIDGQMDNYRKAGFPEFQGLCETGVYVTSPRDPLAQKVFGDWWREIENGSKRDQLSIMYVLWKNKTGFTPLFKNYEDIPRFSTTNFLYFLHRGKRDLRYPSVYQYPHFVQEVMLEPSQGNEYLPLYDRREKPVTTRTTVIVPVHNALADVKNCLAALEQSIDESVRVVLVNDGSELECAEFLRNYAAARPENHSLVDHLEPVGYTVSINEAVRSSPPSDYYVFLNSDTIVPRNWLKKLVRAAESSPSIGVVGPLSNAASWQTVPVLWEGKAFCINRLPPGADVEEMDRRCERFAPQGVYPKTQLINGFCYMVKKSVFDKIGLFDEENFPTGYGEEDDLSLRAVDAGFILAIVPDTYVFHAKSKSFGHATRQKLVAENQKKFYAKHSRDRVRRECKSLEMHPVILSVRAQLCAEEGGD